VPIRSRGKLDADLQSPLRRGGTRVAAVLSLLESRIDGLVLYGVEEARWWCNALPPVPDSDKNSVANSVARTPAKKNTPAAES